MRGAEERSLRKADRQLYRARPLDGHRRRNTDPSNLGLWITVNGELRQKANTRDMVLGVPELIEFASSFYTLWPGDVLLSGTPDGVGPIHAGSLLHAHVDCVGDMDVSVLSA